MPNAQISNAFFTFLSNVLIPKADTHLQRKLSSIVENRGHHRSLEIPLPWSFFLHGGNTDTTAHSRLISGAATRSPLQEFPVNLLPLLPLPLHPISEQVESFSPAFLSSPPMSDATSSSSVHSHRETRECFCGLTSYLLTSKTTQNPGRRFFACPNYTKGVPTCKFFEWYDRCPCHGCCELLPQSITRCTLLEAQLHAKEAKEKRLHFVVIALCGLCLGLTIAVLSITFGSQGCSRQWMLPF